MKISNAFTFWIEAGSMSSASRHQVELPNYLAEYFDDHSRSSELVTVRLPDGSTYTRPFVYRGTDYGQWTEQWRLHLPTVEMGGLDYPGKILKFVRLQEGGSTLYELDVIDPGSSEGAQLEIEAKRAGTLDSTGGYQGRQYGYW